MPSFYKNMHPLILTIILMIINILISMNMSTFSDSGWWSFILFMIMVGSMMILFLYFTSFINNMIMSLKMTFIKNFMLKIIMNMMMMMFLMKTLFMKLNFWTNLFFEIKTLKNLSNNYYMIDPNNLMNMYSYNMNYSTLISVIYLLVSLTFIVKMILTNKFTLRKMN
uniref:NADH dehydrogenase subunit 6 n=1 Tax=Psyllaephagus populi TaxID=3122998 RepID=A0AAU7BNW1_9HYME